MVTRIFGHCQRLFARRRIGEPGTSNRVTEAFFRTTSATLIRHADGSAATAADLMVGKKISLWITGIIMESYPVQVQATEIVIDR